MRETSTPSTATPNGSSTTRIRATTRCHGSSSRARGARRSSITSPAQWQSYDAVIFFTYLYAPTVLGLQIAAERSILAPTAHNEPAIHLGIYKELFQRPKAIAFNTEVEKAFLKATFDIRAVAEETVGCGVDLLAGWNARPSKRAQRSPRRTRSCCTAAASTPARAATSCSIFSALTRKRTGLPRWS